MIAMLRITIAVAIATRTDAAVRPRRSLTRAW
jgi:hypothetical protein